MVKLKRSFLADIGRSVWKTKARFLSIFAMIALGVGFFAGINATRPDMLLTADTYYKTQRLSDFRVLSPFGFRTEDLAAVRAAGGVAVVEPTYIKDLFLTTADGVTATVRLFSHDPAASGSALNQPVVHEGRLPEKSGEIAIESQVGAASGIRIGSVLTASLPAGQTIGDALATTTFTVVGRVSSPLYINFERGQTSIGDGSIGWYAYAARTDFKLERPTDVFVGMSGAESLTAYSQAYKDRQASLTDTLQALGDQAVGDETQELRDKLEQGKRELADQKAEAEQKLAEGEQKLQDAAKEISDGEAELASNETRYTKELADRRAQLKAGRAEYNQGLALYRENEAKWQSGYDAWAAGDRQARAGKAQLDATAAQLAEAERTLAASKAQLDQLPTQISQLEQGISALKIIRLGVPSPLVGMGKISFDVTVASVRNISPELADRLQAAYTDDRTALATVTGQILDAAIADMEKSLATARKALADGPAQYAAGMAQLAAGKTQYAAGLAEWQAGQAQLAASKAELDKGRAELDKAKATLDASAKKLNDGDAALAQGEKDLAAELADGRAKLADARQKLADGRTEYESEKADALLKIADAEAKILDAERQLLEVPKSWYVFSRDANPGYAGYGDDANRIGAVAKVFPLFFFLVAALVCLTTLTRMVEEERSQIGTMKALGYGALTIASKYIVYTLAATLLGTAAGLAVGFRFFPAIIMGAYGIMYDIPGRLTPPQLDYALISGAIAVVTTGSAALLATLGELHATPAVLMQTKAPRPGKRILLERIKPLWKRLSFSNKVTARNIFRYKQRFLMTVIGIAGCTALLVTGFGLRDSISVIMGKQFNEIFLYDATLYLDTDAAPEKRDLDSILGGDPEVSAWLPMLNETVSAVPVGSARTFEANLVVPASADSFSQFYNLRDRRTHKALPLADEGAIISEKLASLLAVRTGDPLTFRDSENRTYTVKITGIAENYLVHYIYLSPEAFAKATLRQPEPNSAAFNVQHPDTLDASAFKEKLLANDSVLGVMFTRGISDSFNDTIASLNFVVLVLILSAGALAFIVLYNLTNINITERMREIATIKVLGFRDQEVSAYVYRENIVLTLFGTLAGIAFGFVMHRYVMGTMEIDNMMFGKDVTLVSYLISAGLTMAFSLLVNFAMYYRLMRINMVESLKSIE